MEAYVQAGVDIHESTLRYAEVERLGSNYRLLKLGSCEFDFNMMQEFENGAHSAHLETVGEALADVFSESTAAELHVVFHPSNCFSFFTPLHVDMSEDERKTRLQQEATLLTSVDVTLPLHLTADAVYSESFEEGPAVEWFHVLGVRDRVHTRFDRVLRSIPPKHYRFNVSTRAAAKTIENIERREHSTEAEPRPYSLAIGYYPTHIEYAICRQHRWYFSHYVASSSHADATYFAAALIKRMKIRTDEIGRVFLYGTGIDSEDFVMLEALFHVMPEALNPIQVMDMEEDGLGSGFAAESYVPCIGVAL